MTLYNSTPLKLLFFFSMLAPVNKGTDTVYSEVRNSQQGMTISHSLFKSFHATQWRNNVDIKKKENKNRKQDQPGL